MAVRVVDRSHADHVVVGCRVAGWVAFGIGIARGSNQQDAPLIGVLDRVAYNGRRIGAGKAHIQYICAVVGGPGEAICQLGTAAAACSIQDFDGHQTGVPIHPGNPSGVVALAGCDAGYVGSVAVVVLGIEVVVHSVKTAHNLPRQVRVAQINACVSDGNDYAAVACGTIPAAVGPDVAQVPLVAVVEAVVGCGIRGKKEIVRLGKEYIGSGSEAGCAGFLLAVFDGQAIETHLAGDVQSGERARFYAQALRHILGPGGCFGQPHQHHSRHKVASVVAGRLGLERSYSQHWYIRRLGAALSQPDCPQGQKYQQTESQLFFSQ